MNESDLNQSDLPVKSDDNHLPATTGPAATAAGILQIRRHALQPLHYSARVTRKDPAAIVILIDQSGSMGETIDKGYGSGRGMSDIVAEIVNDLLDNLTMKCQRDSMIRDYFNLLVIGYGRSETQAEIAWEGHLQGKQWVLVSELKSADVPTRTTKTLITLPWGEKREEERTKRYWISPYAVSLTPMHAAFRLCKTKLEPWVKAHPESFPPMVFNITDGAPTDCTTDELVEVAGELTSLATGDGNVLLFNCLLTNDADSEVLLPSESTLASLSDPYHRALFNASSYLPDEMRNIAAQLFKADRFKKEKTKGVILNSMLSSLTQLLNIGTNTVLSNAHD